MTKLDSTLSQFQRAIKRLDQVLKEQKSDIVRDSAIQRFEFTFDLSWKLIKAFLDEQRGIICHSPKECFRQACKQKIIDYDEFWLEMTDYRNQTSHMVSRRTG